MCDGYLLSEAKNQKATRQANAELAKQLLPQYTALQLEIRHFLCDTVVRLFLPLGIERDWPLRSLLALFVSHRKQGKEEDRYWSQYAGSLRELLVPIILLQCCQASLAHRAHQKLKPSLHQVEQSLCLQHARISILPCAIELKFSCKHCKIQVHHPLRMESSSRAAFLVMCSTLGLGGTLPA